MNTQLTALAATMSSREIAELTGKEHFNVLIDIRTLLDDLGVDPLSFQGVYLAGNGQHRPMFNLPKDLTLTLVSGYSAPLRHRIVSRSMELETTQAPVRETPALTLARALLLAQDTINGLTVQAEGMDL